MRTGLQANKGHTATVVMALLFLIVDPVYGNINGAVNLSADHKTLNQNTSQQQLDNETHNEETIETHHHHEDGLSDSVMPWLLGSIFHPADKSLSTREVAWLLAFNFIIVVFQSKYGDNSCHELSIKSLDPVDNALITSVEFPLAIMVQRIASIQSMSEGHTVWNSHVNQIISLTSGVECDGRCDRDYPLRLACGVMSKSGLVQNLLLDSRFRSNVDHTMSLAPFMTFLIGSQKSEFTDKTSPPRSDTSHDEINQSLLEIESQGSEKTATPTNGMKKKEKSRKTLIDMLMPDTNKDKNDVTTNKNLLLAKPTGNLSTMLSSALDKTRGRSYQIITCFLCLVVIAMLVIDIGARPDQYNVDDIMSSLGTHYRFHLDDKYRDNIARWKTSIAMILIGFSLFHLTVSTWRAIKDYEVVAVSQPIRTYFSDYLDRNSFLEESSSLGKQSNRITDTKPPAESSAATTTEPVKESNDNNKGSDDKEVSSEKSSEVTNDKKKKWNWAGLLKPSKQTPGQITQGSFAQIPTLAKRLMDMMQSSPGARIKANDLKRAMLEVGIDQKFASNILKELPETGITFDSLFSFESRPTMSISEILTSQGANMIFFLILAFGSIVALSVTSNAIDSYVAFVGIAVIWILFVIMYFRARNSFHDPRQVDNLFTSTLEVGMVKLTMMILFIYLFGLVYYTALDRCKRGRVKCDNGAVPICAATGLPPSSLHCDGQVKCVGMAQSSAAVCPDQPIPGSRSDQGEYGAKWTPFQGAELFLAPVHTSECHNGMVSSLCSNSTMYLYALPGVMTSVPNVLGDLGIDPHDVLEFSVNEGFNSCDQIGLVTTLNHTLVMGELFLYTPSHTPMKSIFSLCYRGNTSESFHPLEGNGKTTVLVIAPEAICGDRDCSISDFTSGMDSGFLDSLYFAMVTHSTIGFGDFTPTTARGMMLVSIQSLFVMFLGFF